MNILDTTISNMEKMSNVLDLKCAEYQDSDFGFYLGQLSFELYKDAQALKDNKFLMEDIYA